MGRSEKLPGSGKVSRSPEMLLWQQQHEANRKRNRAAFAGWFRDIRNQYARKFPEEAVPEGASASASIWAKKCESIWWKIPSADLDALIAYMDSLDHKSRCDMEERMISNEFVFSQGDGFDANKVMLAHESDHMFMARRLVKYLNEQTNAGLEFEEWGGPTLRLDYPRVREVKESEDSATVARLLSTARERARQRAGGGAQV